jgi:hypothetical protein
VGVVRIVLGSVRDSAEDCESSAGNVQVVLGLEGSAGDCKSRFVGIMLGIARKRWGA